jgi:hypothetical protein
MKVEKMLYHQVRDRGSLYYVVMFPRNTEATVLLSKPVISKSIQCTGKPSKLILVHSLSSHPIQLSYRYCPTLCLLTNLSHIWVVGKQLEPVVLPFLVTMIKALKTTLQQKCYLSR